ncbi:MAG: cysteine hydrolase [Thermoanaerobaculales bacterium]|jgi:nicotinamidase-related amidase|nr:cysteine hydrolase [Thermoanaerobaculales bacterium]
MAGSMLRVVLGVSLLLAMPVPASSEVAEIDPGGGATALLVIDIQAFYFPGGLMPLVGPEEAAARAGKVIAAFRAAGRPVIHVQHLPKDVDTPDPTGIAEPYRIRPEVLPAPGETIVGKHHASSFRDTELLAVLHELGVTRLVVVGMQTHMCVEAAVRAAADLGFEVTVVHDACATRDLTFDGTTVPAAQVHAAALAAMKGSYAEVVSAAELVGGAR